MSTPSIQTLITQAQQVLNLKSTNEIRATLAAVLANANVGTPLNPNLTTQQLWDEFYEIVRQPSDDIMSIITDQMMRMVFSPPAPGGAGADKQVIFNDGGVLAGDTKFLWDKNANRLDVDGPVVITGDLTVDTTTLVVNPSGYADRVGIGTATPGAALEVSGSATNIYIRSTDTNDSALRYYVNGTEVAVCRGKNGNSYAIETAGAESLRINSTGNIVLKGGTAGATGVGVTFPAAQIVSSDANCLDDYEEGTWTIGLEFGGGTTGLTTSSNAGRYTKVGRQVTVSGYLALSNKGSSVGAAVINGLPFTIGAPNAAYSAASLRLASISYTGAFQAFGAVNGTTIGLEQISTLGAVLSLTDVNFANNSEIIFTITYSV